MVRICHYRPQLESKELLKFEYHPIENLLLLVLVTDVLSKDCKADFRRSEVKHGLINYLFF